MNIVHNVTALNMFLKRLAIAATVASLFACGGGGSTTAPVQTTVTVTPALGGFSAGANVKAVKPDGSTIASGTTDSSGSATLNFADYDGPFTLVVTGGTGVTYFDEKSGTNLPFSSTDSLLSVVPANTINSGVSYGVTPLTNMAAAFAGVNTTGVISGSSTDAINTTITNAVAKTQLTVGISADQLNILTAPTPVTSTTTKLSGTGAATTYGLILAELARSAPTTALAQANGLAVSAQTSVANGTAVSGTEYTGLTATVNTFIATPSALGTNYLASGASLPTITFVTPLSTVTNDQVTAQATQVTTSAPKGTSTTVTGASN